MPLRGGSKSIRNKNILPLSGRPLYAWSLGEAVKSGVFDEIVVATDSEEIGASVTAEFGDSVAVIDRSPASATDTATSEFIMLEVARSRHFDVMALIQATSPLTRADHFAEAKTQFVDQRLDSLLTAVPTSRFVWTLEGKPLNYDPASRPRRQDFAGSLVENGAFYFTRQETLNSTANRLGGKIGIYAMPAETFVELDEPEDVKIIESLLANQTDSPKSVV